MKITVGVSVRHIHLTEEDYNKLFDEPLKEKVPLKQQGMFSAVQTVTIEKDDRRIENVRIVGPLRSYTQVELSRTDAIYLRINPPIRKSGDLEGAEEVKIIGPKGKIIKKAAIIADRHIHINPVLRKKYNLTKDVYKIKKEGEHGGILEDVKIKEQQGSIFELHLDTDDANALNIKQNEEVEIID